MSFSPVFFADDATIVLLFISQDSFNKIKHIFISEQHMKNDGIAVTKHTSSGLLCEAVIHLDMTGVNPSSYGSPFASGSKLKDRIKLALDKAEEIKMATVAFPALG